MSALLLLAVFALLHLPGLRGLTPFRTRRAKAATAMAAMFLFTGTDHFLNPERYLPMLPPALPVPLALIYVSGVLELLGAFGLLFDRWRRWAAWALIALLVAVFPANIYMAVFGGGIPARPRVRGITGRVCRFSRSSSPGLGGWPKAGTDRTLGPMNHLSARKRFNVRTMPHSRLRRHFGGRCGG